MELVGVGGKEVGGVEGFVACYREASQSLKDVEYKNYYYYYWFYSCMEISLSSLVFTSFFGSLRSPTGITHTTAFRICSRFYKLLVWSWVKYRTKHSVAGSPWWARLAFSKGATMMPLIIISLLLKHLEGLFIIPVTLSQSFKCLGLQKLLWCGEAAKNALILPVLRLHCSIACFRSLMSTYGRILSFVFRSLAVRHPYCQLLWIG